MAAGLEAAVHAFFGLLAMMALCSLITLLLIGSPPKKAVRALSMAVAVLVWFAWFAAIPTYTVFYQSDKKAILSREETAVAHEFGMEVKEFIFYPGLLLATLLPTVAYTLSIPEARKPLLLISLVLLFGGFVMLAIGSWVAVSAKIAYSQR